MDKNVKEVISYMDDTLKYTFVNMFAGDFSGLDLQAEREGNALRGMNGEVLCFQYSTISRGTERELQLRTYIYETQEQILDKRLRIGDLFPGHEVIIVTSSDSLILFSPVFADKLDLLLWLRDLNELGDKFPPRRIAEMRELAIFLYQNNPNKVVSIMDEYKYKI